MRPRLSIHASEPPPAPSDLTSTVGTEVQIPMTSPRVRRSGVASRTSATSYDVPPTSQVIARVTSLARATIEDAVTPAAGPDAARRIGTRRASSVVIDPPPE